MSSSSSSSVSHISATDSRGEQAFSLESFTKAIESRVTNVGLPAKTFYHSSKPLPSSVDESPSKNLRARKLDFGPSADSDLESLSPVPSPVDDSDDDKHWRPKKRSSSSDTDGVVVATPITPAKKDIAKRSKTSKTDRHSSNGDVVPQVQSKKRGHPVGSKTKKNTCF